MAGSPKKRARREAATSTVPVPQQASVPQNSGSHPAPAPAKPGSKRPSGPVTAISTNGAVHVNGSGGAPPVVSKPIAQAPRSGSVPVSALPEDTEKIFRPKFWLKAIYYNVPAMIITFVMVICGLIGNLYLIQYLNGVYLWYSVLFLWIGCFWLAGSWAGKLATRPALVFRLGGAFEGFPDKQRWWERDERLWPARMRMTYERQDISGKPKGKPIEMLVIDATEATLEPMNEVLMLPKLDAEHRDAHGREIVTAGPSDIAFNPLAEASTRRVLSMPYAAGRNVKLMILLGIVAVSIIAMYMASNQFRKARLEFDLDNKARAEAAADVQPPAQGVPSDPGRIR